MLAIILLSCNFLMLGTEKETVLLSLLYLVVMRLNKCSSTSYSLMAVLFPPILTIQESSFGTSDIEHFLTTEWRSFLYILYFKFLETDIKDSFLNEHFYIYSNRISVHILIFSEKSHEMRNPVFYLCKHIKFNMCQNATLENWSRVELLRHCV